MHLLPVYITDRHKEFLFDRKKETKLSVSVQIREAIDMYIDVKGDEKK